MLLHEDTRRIAPFEPRSVLSLLRAIYPRFKEGLGVLILEVGTTKVTTPRDPALRGAAAARNNGAP
jgi:hypothetical protein